VNVDGMAGASMLRLLVSLSVALLLGCASTSAEPEAPGEATRIEGTVIASPCPFGRVAVSFPWHVDPRQAGIRYIRDPGPTTRCLESDSAAVLRPGDRVVLVVRDDDLRVSHLIPRKAGH
jgi:hypothetical protein